MRPKKQKCIYSWFCFFSFFDFCFFLGAIIPDSRGMMFFFFYCFVFLFFFFEAVGGNSSLVARLTWLSHTHDSHREIMVRVLGVQTRY